MSKPDVIKIDNVEYVRKNFVRTIESPIKIVILQRGWVMIGRFKRIGSDCKLYDASVVRNWGTTKGLGELTNGPLKNTKLDKCYGLVEFDWLTVVASIDVKERTWKKEL